MQSRTPSIDARERERGGGPVGAAPSLHARLRCETTAEHGELERKLHLVDPELSAARYRHVLQTLYGFYAPLEPRLARLSPLVPMSGLPLRDRAALLARDLVELGLSGPEVARLPCCGELPRTTSAEQLAGCLYVLEGASLGGQLIARAIARQPDPSSTRATAFFTGDGARTGARWRRVLQWLHAHEAAGARSDEIVTAARETFVQLGRWVERQDAAQ